MENYFIIHGSFGSPFGNWFSWLHDFIEDEGKQVYVPDFPIGVGYQNYENWILYLLKGIEQTSKETIQIINKINDEMQKMKYELRNNKFTSK